jgi:uncharacterized FlaG/YvyC family protein
MSDPISPTGSLGQVPLVAPGPNATSARYTGVSTGPAPQASNQAAHQAAAAGIAMPAGGPAAAHAPQGPSTATQQAQAHPPVPAGADAVPTLEEATKSFQEYLKNLPSDLQFRPDAESGIVVFKVVNPLTQEVIRQYPPEAVVEMARWIRQNAAKNGSGIFLDEKL